MILNLIMYFALTVILVALAWALDKAEGCSEITYEDLGWFWWVHEPKE